MSPLAVMLAIASQAPPQKPFHAGPEVHYFNDLLPKISVAPSIGELLAIKSKDVVGKYYHADGFSGQTLDLRRNGSFESTWTDDVIIPGEEEPVRRRGKWSLAKDVVEVRYQNPKGWPREHHYIPVRWDGTWFLVESNRKKGFVAYVAKRRDMLRNEVNKCVFGHSEFLCRSAVPHAFGAVKVPKRFVKDFSSP